MAIDFIFKFEGHSKNDNHSYERENFQKQYFLRVLKGCHKSHSEDHQVISQEDML